MALSSEIESDIFEKATGAKITEDGGTSTIRFSPGLDEETIESVQQRMQEEAGASDWEEVPDRWNGVSHGGDRKTNSSFTDVEVSQNHFGIFRHNRAEIVLETVGAVLLGESGIRLELKGAPKDFYLGRINAALRDLSSD